MIYLPKKRVGSSVSCFDIDFSLAIRLPHRATFILSKPPGWMYIYVEFVMSMQHAQTFGHSFVYSFMATIIFSLAILLLTIARLAQWSDCGLTI